MAEKPANFKHDFNSCHRSLVNKPIKELSKSLGSNQVMSFREKLILRNIRSTLPLPAHFDGTERQALVA